jgi:hypothetical protein
MKIALFLAMALGFIYEIIVQFWAPILIFIVIGLAGYYLLPDAIGWFKYSLVCLNGCAANL